MKKKSKLPKHLVIPDCQVKPGVPLDHLDWCSQFIAEKRPDVIVCIGDFADMPSLSSYDKGKRSFEGRRYSKDIDSVHTAMTLLVGGFRGIRGYKPRMVMTLGNHEDRINRAVDNDPMLDGTISTADLGYAEYGWEVHDFLKVVKVDGIHYSHYFCSGPMGRPVGSARALLTKKHVSCIQGHHQHDDLAGEYGADGRRIRTMFGGAFYQHDEKYLGPQGNRHWRGVRMLHRVRDGDFDLMEVSMGYLKERYGR